MTHILRTETTSKRQFAALCWLHLIRSNSCSFDRIGKRTDYNFDIGPLKATKDRSSKMLADSILQGREAFFLVDFQYMRSCMTLAVDFEEN